MICSPRLKKILTTLLETSSDYVRIDDLAASMKISRRTIFREMENVNDLISVTGVVFESKTGKGIRLVGTKEQKDQLSEALSVEDVAYVNREERQKLLAYELLRDQSIRKLIYYASMFQVSEATISHDIDALEPLFQENGIRLLRKGKNRIEIQAPESRRRILMMKIVHDQLDAFQNTDAPARSYGSLKQIFLNNTPESIMSLLNQDILNRVLSIFSANLHELNLDRFSQSSYVGLILHLVVAVERILKHESISAGKDVFKLVEDKTSYEEAREIASQLEKEFEIDIPEIEIAYIAMHLQGSKLVSMPSSPDEKEDPASRKAAKFASDLMDGFDLPIRITLQQDEQFMQGILTHLEPTLIRLENNLPIYNPLLDQLKTQYSALFEQCRKAVDHLEELYGYTISDEEVGFITMHVGACIERDGLKTWKRPVRVGIVCASGIGVSALLAARVQKQFQSQISVKTLSMEDVYHQSYGGSELLLSTFSLLDTRIPALQVSFLLCEKDVDAIQKELNSFHERQVQSEMRTDSSYAELLDKIIDLASAQKEILKNLVCLQVEDESSVESLIEFAARTFQGDSAIIRQSLLERESLGSVIATDYGFAMFHAATAGTQKPQFVILLPKKEFFETSGLEQIRFIAAAIIPKENNHYQRECISCLSSSLISDSGFVQAICTRNQKHLETAVTHLFRKQMEQSLRNE